MPRLVVPLGLSFPGPSTPHLRYQGTSSSRGACCSGVCCSGACCLGAWAHAPQGNANRCTQNKIIVARFMRPPGGQLSTTRNQVCRSRPQLEESLGRLPVIQFLRQQQGNLGTPGGNLSKMTERFGLTAAGERPIESVSHPQPFDRLFEPFIDDLDQARETP